PRERVYFYAYFSGRCAHVRKARALDPSAIDQHIARRRYLERRDHLVSRPAAAQAIVEIDRSPRHELAAHDHAFLRCAERALFLGAARLPVAQRDERRARRAG